VKCTVFSGSYVSDFNRVLRYWTMLSTLWYWHAPETFTRAALPSGE